MTDTPGVLRTEVYTEPVHYEAEDGRWVDLDPKLVEVDRGRYRSEGTGTPVSLDAAGDTTTVSVDFGADLAAGFRLASNEARLNPSEGVEVEEIDEGVDLVLEAVPGGLKETLILASPSSPRRFEFPLDLRGLTPRVEEEGSVSLLDGSGRRLGIIPPGWMEDSSAHPVTAEPASTFAVDYSIKETSGAYTLVVELDEEWLDAPERVFPVRVDPSILQANAGLDDTYVMAYSPANRSHLSTLSVGHNGYLGTRSFLHFPALEDHPLMRVHHAELKLFQNGAGSCTPSPMDIYRVGSDWSGDTTTTWGGPAPSGPPVTTITSAKGQPGCAQGWVQTNVTDLVDDWVTGGATNHGITLRASDESAPTAFKQFGSGDSLAPPHIQVLWSEPDPAPPLVQPMADLPATIGTLTPTLATPYEDLDQRPGGVVYLLYDSENQLVTIGLGELALSGTTSAWSVPGGTLDPGSDYSVVTFGVSEAGVASANGPPQSFSTSAAAFTGLAADQVHFGDTSVTVEVAGGPVDRVDLVVIGGTGGAVVASDPTAPYQLTWDTTSTPDGPTLVAAVAVSGSTQTDAHPVSVEVRNDTSGPERAEIDRQRGTLTVDQAALITVQSALGDPATPVRYQSDVESGSTHDIVGMLTEHGDALSTATKDAIDDLLAPEVTYDPQPQGRGPTADDCEADYNAAINQVLKRRMCVAFYDLADDDVPPINLYYSLDTGTHDLEGELAADTSPANTIPDGIDIAIENMVLAVETYLGMGYELPSYIEDYGFTVAFHDKPGYANPWRRSNSLYPHAITLRTTWDRELLAATARHETFHVFQYNYMSLYDVTGDLCPGTWCRPGGFWWIEATAEWADHQVGEENLALLGEDLYARSLGAFAASPEVNLYTHVPGLPAFPGLSARGYGAFIFAESLEERYGADFILSVFEYFEDNPTNPAAERDLVESLEAALDDEGTDLHTELWRFWISFYLLSGEGDLSFDDPDLGLWRTVLTDASQAAHPELAGDSFSPLARVDRRGSPIVVSQGSGDTRSSIILLGGANVVELDSVPPFRGQPAFIDIDVNPSRHMKLSFGLIRIADEGYPNLCPSGPAIVPDSDGDADIEWTPTDACPQAAIVINHLDPNSSYGLGGDRYHLSVRGAVGPT